MSYKYQNSLVWLRRDLRLHDNKALYKALDNSQYIAIIFVFDTNILNKLKSKKDKRVTFIYESIKELREALKNQYNADLIIKYGDPLEIIPDISQQLNVDAVFSAQDFEIYPQKRDKNIAAQLQKHNIDFVQTIDHVLYNTEDVSKPKGGTYTIYTPFKKRVLVNLEESNYEAIQLFDSIQLLQRTQFIQHTYSNNILLEDIGFEHAGELICGTGEYNAQTKLKSFLSSNITTYKTSRDYPHQASTSTLSVDLRFGTISHRQCYRKAFALLSELLHDSEEYNNITHWISELIWREFHSVIMRAFPHTITGCFLEQYNEMPWNINQDLFMTWTQGQTGVPIVDAGINELLHTGNMHNRVRMIVASFLTKNLFIHWKYGERFFAEHLLDYDFASNNGNWQWVASVGTDAAPYFRIFNPITQASKFDRDNLYINKWLPVNYNLRPIVDIKQSRANAIEKFKQFKESDSRELNGVDV